MQHRDITVSGKVQGVFFRAATLAKARELGVHGRVSNRPDGSVFVAAEGPPALLDDFIAWLHVGPPTARVDTVTAVDGAIEGYQDFEISR